MIAAPNDPDTQAVKRTSEVNSGVGKTYMEAPAEAYSNAISWIPKDRLYP